MAGTQQDGAGRRERDPYTDASPEQREEYNRFGPWLQEVREEADMPPCFREHYPTYAQARFLVKAPINVERRNAHPGMELYRSVLAVDAESVCLLTRESGRTDTRAVATQAIQAIRISQKLLRGELSLYLEDGERLEFHYNAVSQPLVESIVDFLRSRFQPRTSGFEGRYAPEVEDFYFQNLFEEHAFRKPSTVALHCEAPGRRIRGAWGRRWTYLGLLALATDRDLVMVDQGKTMRRRKEAVYACRTTYLPWAFLTGAAETDPDAAPQADYRTLVLRVGSKNVFCYDMFEPEPLLKALEKIPSA